MTRVKINENNIFTALTVGSSLLLAVLTAAALLFASLSFAAGVAAGGVVAIANCHWLYSILQRAMSLPPRQAARFARFRYFLRLGIIAVTVSLLILYGKINLFGLLLGLSVVVVTITLMAVYMATLNGG